MISLESNISNKESLKTQVWLENTNLQPILKKYSKNSSDPETSLNIYLMLAMEVNLILFSKLNTLTLVMVTRSPILWFLSFVLFLSYTMVVLKMFVMTKLFLLKTAKTLRL